MDRRLVRQTILALLAMTNLHTVIAGRLADLLLLVAEAQYMVGKEAGRSEALTMQNQLLEGLAEQKKANG